MPGFNSWKAELNPICHLLALVGAHHILHVSRIRVNSNTTHSTHNPLAEASQKGLHSWASSNFLERNRAALVSGLSQLFYEMSSSSPLLSFERELFSLAPHFLLCDVTTLSQERDCISVRKFLDIWQIFVSNDCDNVTISCIVALKIAALSRVTKLSFCQSQNRITSDGHSVTKPTGHEPPTKSGRLLSDGELQVFL